MRRLVPLLAVLAAAAAAQPVVPPSRPSAPPLWGRGPETTRPLHSSAARAYAYSAAATAGSVGLGYVLYRVLPEGDPTRESFAPRDLGLGLVVVGVLAGPSVGNLTLGARGDAERAVKIKGVSVAAGGVLVVGAIGVALGCWGQPDCAGAPLAEGLFYGGVAVAAAGVAAGTVYDLATIPRNARAAREGRAVRVRPSGAGLAVVVGL